jgi:hypothetical protein
MMLSKQIKFTVNFDTQVADQILQESRVTGIQPAVLIRAHTMSDLANSRFSQDQNQPPTDPQRNRNIRFR